MIGSLTADSKAARNRKIRDDIERHGLSVTLVSGAPSPRFAYTIGLRDVSGFDLILAGASYYTAREVHEVLNRFAHFSKENHAVRAITISPFGSFSLRFAHDSWVSRLALAALDFYNVDQAPVAQLVPDKNHWTNDVPDMEREWDPEREPAWQWLSQAWEYTPPSNSVVTTNLAALRGAPITELARWEDTSWEMFAGHGPDVTPDEVRVIPLGTLLAFDDSLSVALDRRIGEGYWRDDGSSSWHEWKRTHE